MKIQEEAPQGGQQGATMKIQYSEKREVFLKGRHSMHKQMRPYWTSSLRQEMPPTIIVMIIIIIVIVMIAITTIVTVIVSNGSMV